MSSKHVQNDKTETQTVLVLQGGGSLGAYECGVYNTLHKEGITFDIIAGSSIGGINASIIASAQNSDKEQDAANILKDFWLELAEDIETKYPWPFSNYYNYYSNYYPESYSEKARSISHSMFSVLFGNPKAFVPRWFLPDLLYYPPNCWNYLYLTAV